MEKIVSIIGTRPQYVKVKPIFDYCLEHGIQHEIWDTNQHYDDSVSKNMIESLGLKIDFNFGFSGFTERFFISQMISHYYQEDCKFILYGDTNSSFAAAVALHKAGRKFGHVEAGARCHNRSVPEEINRMYIDSVASVNFCTKEADMKNCEDAVLSGDLEIEFLNDHFLLNRSEHRSSGKGIMTLHRKENMNKKRVQDIFDFVGSLDHEVDLLLHHSLNLKDWFCEIPIPKNMTVRDPLNYIEMITALDQCSFILTDSGSLQKTSAFFGKPCLVFRNESGWTETVDQGFSRFAKLNKEDFYFVKQQLKPDPNLYFGNSSEVIINTMLKL